MLYLTIHHFSVWIDKITKIAGLTDDVLWGKYHLLQAEFLDK